MSGKKLKAIDPKKRIANRRKKNFMYKIKITQGIENTYFSDFLSKNDPINNEIKNIW